MIASGRSSVRGGGFIESLAYDGVFFLAAPLWSLVLGYAVSLSLSDGNVVFIAGEKVSLTSMMLRAIIHAHLVIVLFRSHGNPDVRQRHPIRFWVVPPVLLIATYASAQVLLVVIILTTFWDNYHSSLQTFGIGRIYDQRVGADVHRGRALDAMLNLLLYFVPFMAGPLWPVVIRLFEDAGLPAGHWFLQSLHALQPWVKRALWLVVPVFSIIYVVHVFRRLRSGEPWSWQKYLLYLTTGVTSVWAWGFNAFGEALFIVNVFHAVQYFAIVWRMERKTIVHLLGCDGLPWPRFCAASGLILVGGMYGLWFAGLPSSVWARELWVHRAVLALTNTVALLHFWYDGFIWSVRKNHVG